MNKGVKAFVSMQLFSALCYEGLHIYPEGKVSVVINALAVSPQEDIPFGLREEPERGGAFMRYAEQVALSKFGFNRF